MNPEENTYCHYSDLPSPMAYMQEEDSLDNQQILTTLTEVDLPNKPSSQDNNSKSNE